MERASRRSLLTAVAAAAALAVAGCGDDEGTDTAAQETAGDTADEQTDTTTGGAGGGSTVQVDAVEFAFQPPDPTVEEDGDVSIELTNEGDLPHALTIEETNASSETIEGGQSTTMQASLDSGEYTIYCPVGDHRQQGMEGTLTVGGGNGGGGDDSGSGADDSGSDDDSGGDDDSAAGGSGAGY